MTQKSERRTDRMVVILVVLFAAVILIIGTLTIDNHFIGQSNHKQGTNEQNVLNEQRDFAAWLIKTQVINHETICAVAAQRNIVCPPLPPLPTSIEGFEHAHP